MEIQSLSVVVPSKKCMNDCQFCVSKMHCDNYKNQMDDNLPFFDLYMNDYLKRLEFARHNGCNTVMITGNSEPQQNRKFLTYFGMFMRMMRDPFQWIEMQTTGAGIDQNYLRFLRNHVGVNLISLSVSSLNVAENAGIIRCPEFKVPVLNELASEKTVRALENYVLSHGRLLGTLPYGARKYSLHGMSVVIDTDCMAKNIAKRELERENYKYLILQPDCKLYSQWDDPASLIF